MPHKVALKLKAKLWAQPQVEGVAGVAGGVKYSHANEENLKESSRERQGWAGQGLGHAGDNVQRQTIFIFPLSPQGLLGEYVEEEEGAPRQCRKYFICHAQPSTARIFRLN